MTESNSTYCCVPGCDTDALKDNDSSITFHKFPTHDTRIFNKWIIEIDSACKEPGGVRWLPKVNAVVCSKHFKAADFENDLLKPQAKPTVFIKGTNQVAISTKQTESLSVSSKVESTVGQTVSSKVPSTTVSSKIQSTTVSSKLKSTVSTKVQATSVSSKVKSSTVVQTYSKQSPTVASKVQVPTVSSKVLPKKVTPSADNPIQLPNVSSQVLPKIIVLPSAVKSVQSSSVLPQVLQNIVSLPSGVKPLQFTTVSSQGPSKLLMLPSTEKPVQLRDILNRSLKSEEGTTPSPEQSLDVSLADLKAKLQSPAGKKSGPQKAKKSFPISRNVTSVPQTTKASVQLGDKRKLEEDSECIMIGKKKHIKVQHGPSKRKPSPVTGSSPALADKTDTSKKKTGKVDMSVVNTLTKDCSAEEKKNVITAMNKYANQSVYATTKTADPLQASIASKQLDELGFFKRRPGLSPVLSEDDSQTQLIRIGKGKYLKVCRVPSSKPLHSSTPIKTYSKEAMTMTVPSKGNENPTDIQPEDSTNASNIQLHGNQRDDVIRGSQNDEPCRSLNASKRNENPTNIEPEESTNASNIQSHNIEELLHGDEEGDVIIDTQNDVPCNDLNESKRNDNPTDVQHEESLNESNMQLHSNKEDDVIMDSQNDVPCDSLNASKIDENPTDIQPAKSSISSNIQPRSIDELLHSDQEEDVIMGPQNDSPCNDLIASKGNENPMSILPEESSIASNIQSPSIEELLHSDQEDDVIMDSQNDDPCNTLNDEDPLTEMNDFSDFNVSFASDEISVASLHTSAASKEQPDSSQTNKSKKIPLNPGKSKPKKKPPVTKGQLPLKKLASKVNKKSVKQVPSHISPSPMYKLPLEEENALLKKKVEELKKQVMPINQLTALERENILLKKELEQLKNLQKGKEEIAHRRLKTILEESRKGDATATYLLDQINGFGGKLAKFSNSTYLHCALLWRKNPHSYDMFRKADIFRLPSFNGADRYIKRNRFTGSNPDDTKNGLVVINSNSPNKTPTTSPDKRSNGISILTNSPRSQARMQSHRANSDNAAQIQQQTVEVDYSSTELREVVLETGEVLQCFSSDICIGEDGHQYFILREGQGNVISEETDHSQGEYVTNSSGQVQYTETEVAIATGMIS